jgi:hypothetical protein
VGQALERVDLDPVVPIMGTRVIFLSGEEALALCQVDAADGRIVVDGPTLIAEGLRLAEGQVLGPQATGNVFDGDTIDNFRTDLSPLWRPSCST